MKKGNFNLIKLREKQGGVFESSYVNFQSMSKYSAMLNMTTGMQKLHVRMCSAGKMDNKRVNATADLCEGKISVPRNAAFNHQA